MEFLNNLNEMICNGVSASDAAGETPAPLSVQGSICTGREDQSLVIEEAALW